MRRLQLFGATTPLPGAGARAHGLRSMVGALQGAVAEVEAEVALLGGEAEGLLAEVRGTVRGMSDLRYGRLAGKGLADEVRGGLEGLRGVAGGR